MFCYLNLISVSTRNNRVSVLSPRNYDVSCVSESGKKSEPSDCVNALREETILDQVSDATLLHATGRQNAYIVTSTPF